MSENRVMKTMESRDPDGFSGVERCLARLEAEAMSARQSQVDRLSVSDLFHFLVQRRKYF